MTAELTPDALAELWRLLDSATARPWVVDDEGDDVAVIVDEGDEFSFIQIAADLHQGDDGLTDARLIVAAVNNLPALLDAAAERDALAAKVERVRALHRPAYNDAGRTPICETCHGKAGVHPCGCWSDEDYQPVCAVCNEGHKGISVPYPCPTIRALDGGEP